MLLKGDTVIGNHVWIGENTHIGHGANSVAGSNVLHYSVVVGNPSKLIRKTLDDEIINLMLEFKWWDKNIEEINALIRLLLNINMEKVEKQLINTYIKNHRIHYYICKIKIIKRCL